MREQLLSEILEALIVIRGLIVQKTKLISDCSQQREHAPIQVVLVEIIEEF